MLKKEKLKKGLSSYLSLFMDDAKKDNSMVGEMAILIDAHDRIKMRMEYLANKILDCSKTEIIHHPLGLGAKTTWDEKKLNRKYFTAKKHKK